MIVIGWVDCWSSPYKQVAFTEDRKKALVERIRKRKYNFNYFDHEMLGCAPVYDDKTVCILTRSQFDDVMAEAYKDTPRGARLLPQDAITRPPINSVLYEKEKFEPKGDGNNE